MVCGRAHQHILGPPAVNKERSRVQERRKAQAALPKELASQRREDQNNAEVLSNVAEVKTRQQSEHNQELSAMTENVSVICLRLG